jgi:SAM-dependent methyltransferase
MASSGVYQRKDISAVVYDALAPIYDRLMSHVEYEEWLLLIERIIKRSLDDKNPAVFELGGGTGILGSMLRERGWRYFGSDRSFNMCKVSAGRNIPFFCADARAIPLKKPFDFFLFLYDGINYLQTPQEYSVVFNEVYNCLAPGGFFLFDITTEANSLNHFKSYIEFEDWGDFSYIRRSYYNKSLQEQHNDFTMYRKINESSPYYERLVECHCQKVFGAGTIARAVSSSQYTIEGIWDGFSFRNHRPHSERIHFLLKKRPL